MINFLIADSLAFRIKDLRYCSDYVQEALDIHESIKAALNDGTIGLKTGWGLMSALRAEAEAVREFREERENVLQI
ncbi:MAG: hypothetical protein E7679_04760 [Ruminococcaceae bacterium]|nr:hypothetical protein [Oscillospiraceae bacterium]